MENPKPFRTRTRLLLLASIGAALLTTFFVVRSRSGARSSLALSQWHQQTAGMEKALSLHQAGGEPLLVYFYTDW